MSVFNSSSKDRMHDRRIMKVSKMIVSPYRQKELVENIRPTKKPANADTDPKTYHVIK